jgi:hypothetical protein
MARANSKLTPVWIVSNSPAMPEIERVQSYLDDGRRLEYMADGSLAVVFNTSGGIWWFYDRKDAVKLARKLVRDRLAAAKETAKRMRFKLRSKGYRVTVVRPQAKRNKNERTLFPIR